MTASRVSTQWITLQPIASMVYTKTKDNPNRSIHKKKKNSKVEKITIYSSVNVHSIIIRHSWKLHLVNDCLSDFSWIKILLKQRFVLVFFFWSEVFVCFKVLCLLWRRPDCDDGIIRDELFCLLFLDVRRGSRECAEINREIYLYMFNVQCLCCVLRCKGTWRSENN